MIDFVVANPNFHGFSVSADNTLWAHVVKPGDSESPHIDGSSVTLSDGSAVPIHASFRTSRKVTYAHTPKRDILMKVT